MPEVNTETRAPQTYEDLAGIMELPLIAPELSEEQIANGCEAARRHGLAAVIVRPSDLDLAARWTGSSLALGTAIDWPYGYSTTATKQYAARDALRRGAKEITVTMNSGKMISRQFQYLEMELTQIAEACREVHARLTVNLESPNLTEEHKIVACRVAKRAGADFLAATDPSDIPLLLTHARERFQVKAREVQDLDAALNAFAAGCTRMESANAAQILEAWKVRITPEVPQQDV